MMGSAINRNLIRYVAGAQHQPTRSHVICISQISSSRRSFSSGHPLSFQSSILRCGTTSPLKPKKTVGGSGGSATDEQHPVSPSADSSKGDSEISASSGKKTKSAEQDAAEAEAARPEAEKNMGQYGTGAAKEGVETKQAKGSERVGLSKDNQEKQ